MSPRLDAAFRAIKRDRAQDLKDLRFSALAFKVAVGGKEPIAVAYAIDDEGVEHWLAARSATRSVEAAYMGLLSDLLLRGLGADRDLDRRRLTVRHGGCELDRHLDARDAVRRH